MRILFVTPYLPSPPGFGGQRRMHGMMSGLARTHEVSALSLVNPAESHEGSLGATREYCREVVTIPNPAFALDAGRKRLLQLRSLGSRRSFEWLTHANPAFAAELRRLLARGRFDIVSFEFAQMGAFRTALGAGELHGARTVLDEHNVEHEILRRTAATEAGLVRRLYSAVNWRKLRHEELDAVRSFDGCTVTSVHDQALLLRDVPQARTAVVPNAADVEHFKPRAGAPAREPMTILFFGAINYFPNADGLQFFLREIFPRVLARCPAARLRVVGHTPRELFALSGENVEMKGLVDDVRVELERTAAVIAPLRVGGGTRLKILEAMAMGKAVVSTSQGAEGLEVAHGRELLIADEPAAFASELCRVLEDAALARGLGAAARRLVEDRYGWPAAVATLERFYQQLAATP